MDKEPRLLQLVRNLLSGIRGILAIIEQQKEGTTPKSAQTANTADENSNIPPFVRASVQIIDGVEIHKSKADTTKEAGYQFWTLFISACSLGVAVLTLISLIIYACITHGQLVEMRKATKATQDAATAARDSADAAKHSVEISEDQFRQAERPYIWAYPVAGPNNVV